jgi:hypothetical protein
MEKELHNSLRLTNQVRFHRQKRQTVKHALLTFNLNIIYMSKALKKRKHLYFWTHTCVHRVSGICTPSKAKKGAVDNTGRHHVGLYGTCDVCDKEILLAHVHIDDLTGKLFN